MDLRSCDVICYLDTHPEVLERYVQNNVSLERVESWLLARRYREDKHCTRNGSKGAGASISRSKRASIDMWKYSGNSDKQAILQEMIQDISTNSSKGNVLNDMAACVCASIKADGYNLYFVNEDKGSISIQCNPSIVDSRIEPSSWKIGPGNILAAYVAFSKLQLNITHHGALYDKNLYPDGTGAQIPANTEFLLCQPIIQFSGEVIGVVELYRLRNNHPFLKEDEEISSNSLFYGGVISRTMQIYHTLKMQKKMNEFLLTVTKSIFQDIISIDCVIIKIMNYAKKLVNADRTALFLTDTKTKELYARVFDLGDDSINPELQCVSASNASKQKEIRFPMNKGVAGHVATTGNILNITNAYDDNRFNREVDAQTGYHTRTILCMPIMIRGNMIGVIQMVNKQNGVFTTQDEESFEMFAVYCGLALHHAKLYEKLRRSEQKSKVSLEVLSYHNVCSSDELKDIQEMDLPNAIPKLEKYTFSPWDVSSREKPLYVVYMLTKLFGNVRYDLTTLTRFALTVRKNYRNVPYHNWEHAFSVAHAIFTILQSQQQHFNTLERLALFVACLCHDMDHRGKTNTFMVKNGTPLASIYGTSTMEHHHFNQTIVILQNDGHNVFQYFTSDQYKKALGDIKHCILATDLASFFSTQASINDLADTNTFDWESNEHKRLLMATTMTASDLCAMYKPWSVQRNLVDCIMEEFWQQGDEEKKKGINPIPMMDREKIDELPQSQVGFLVGICLPCYESLAKIIADSAPMINGAKKNLKIWQEMVEKSESESD